MISRFFYSKSTGLYVSRKPLKIDSRVKKAAEKANIKLNWDDEGRINFIDFNTTKQLLSQLGSSNLSPIEYWKVLDDAKKVKDKEMINELTSDRYCEWLDRVYLKEGFFIDHPKILTDYKYSGKKHETNQPTANPGWFNPENNINHNYGVPKKVELFRDKFSLTWKYWSPDFSVTTIGALAPIRGYVTSVGKPSLDMSIPVFAKQYMLMIRECRKIPLESPIPEKVLKKFDRLLSPYVEITENLQNKRKYELVYKEYKTVLDFVSKYGFLFNGLKELEIYTSREQLFNLLGLIKILSLSKKDLTKVKEIDSKAKIISGVKNNYLNYKDFLDFVKNAKNSLTNALKQRKDIVFVMGHKNPDTDAIVATLYEAWRNHLINGDQIAYIAIVQNHKIPDEVRSLLGDNLTKHVMLDIESAYKEAKKSGLARWISVDQNREPEVQKYFISIIDHHVVSEVAKFQEIPKTLEMTGSSSALITQKFLGMGLNFDQELAKLLYGATLMDTENRVFHKMTYKDHIVMDYLKELSKIKDDNKFYSNLMSFLLNTDDPVVLFKRDYKEDWGFGFAVAKIKNGFDKQGVALKKELEDKAIRLAKQNNEDKNLPLTVLRITDYNDDNETVNRERVYFVFNKNAKKEFIKTTFDLLENIIKFEFGNVNILRTNEFIEFWGSGTQLSRKKTAPVLEPVVRAFNEYFYSPSVGLYIKRDFLKKTGDVIKSAKNLKLSTDKENRINYITYPEARALVEALGFSILSLREYWLVLKDAEKIRDVQIINSLKGSNFVEFLDTIIKDYNHIIEHPNIKGDGKEFTGKIKKVYIPKGKPGLIHPKDIDLNTGIPKIVRSPDQYGDTDLWRYWEPDSDLVIPTRSYIFLLNQPCWDGKFHIKDSFPNLGIRPCCKEVKPPKIKINFNKEKLNIFIEKEGDLLFISSWKKILKIESGLVKNKL